MTGKGLFIRFREGQKKLTKYIFLCFRKFCIFFSFEKKITFSPLRTNLQLLDVFYAFP